MNRVIKFRVWDPHAKVFVKLDQLFIGLDGHLWQYVYGDPETISIEACSDRLVSEQFTGILDKKRCEIYEGDILKVDCSDYVSVMHVEYLPENLCYTLRKRSINPNIRLDMYLIDDLLPITRNGQYNGHTCQVSVDRLEVIGNIHEHLHLLNPVTL